MTAGVEPWEDDRFDAVLERPLAVWAAAAGVAGAAELLLHNSLFHGAPLGIGFTLAVMATAVLLVSSGPLTGVTPSVPTRLFAAAMAVFGLFVTFRASPVLTTLNVITVLALLFGAAFLYSTGRLQDLHLMDYPRAGLVTATEAIIQTGLFFRVDLPMAQLQPVRSWQRVRPYLRGVVIALVPMAVFAALFASADAIFATWLHALVGIDIGFGTLAWSIVLIVLIGWILIGLLRYGSSAKGMERLERPEGMHLGAKEAFTVLALVNALFLVFVGVQFRYLFGGASVIEGAGNLTRAEYAREGFFQLVIVAGFVLALILLLDWWTRPAGARASRRVNQLQAGLVMLTTLVLASALERMRLYVDEFGLTQLRFYALAVMLWIGFLLVWALATVLPGRRALFGTGAFLSALVMVAGLNFVNPDATIARVNIDRFVNHGAAIDLEYLTHRLSADAVPVLNTSAEMVPRLVVPADDTPGPRDWRNFNLSRSRAGG